MAVAPLFMPVATYMITTAYTEGFHQLFLGDDHVHAVVRVIVVFVSFVFHFSHFSGFLVFFLFNRGPPLLVENESSTCGGRLDTPCLAEFDPYSALTDHVDL